MSVIRRPFFHENYHIFYKGLCENTFIKYVCRLLDTTNVKNIFNITDNTHWVLNDKVRG